MEPRNLLGHRSADLRLTGLDDCYSSTRQEDLLRTSARPAMTLDFAEMHDLEPSEMSNVQDPAQEGASSLVLPRASGDNNGKDGRVTTWTPTQETVNLSQVIDDDDPSQHADRLTGPFSPNDQANFPTTVQEEGLSAFEVFPLSSNFP